MKLTEGLALRFSSKGGVERYIGGACLVATEGPAASTSLRALVRGEAELGLLIRPRVLSRTALRSGEPAAWNSIGLRRT